jgi:hypothetical protein
MRLNCGKATALVLPEVRRKYRPHRPHRHEYSDLQDFLAVDPAIGIDCK